MIVFLITACDAFEGPPAKKYFDKTLGFDGEDFAQTMARSKDGNFIIAGYTNSFRPNNDMYLIKIDQQFDIIWSKTIGGNFNDRAGNIQSTSDNGLIAIGTVSLSGSNSDLFLVRTDLSGSVLWSRNYGGDGKDEGHSVCELSNGDFIVAGSLSGATPNVDMYILRLDSRGFPRWSQTIGDENTEFAQSIATTADGGFIVAGYISFISSPTTNWDLMLVKLNGDGQIEWERTFNNRQKDTPFIVKQTSDGGYIAVCRTTAPDPGGDTNIWIVKTDAAGNLVWSRELGNSYEDIGYGMADAENGYIICGTTYAGTELGAQVYLANIGMDGQVLWEKTYGDGGSDVANACYVLENGSIIVAGYTQRSGNSDIYMMKLDRNGNLE